ncbi:hypothetical protein D9756_000143 [Leucocoprinus leucothites]|uniref:DnaJ homologue subfamily C member 28 conserved domain-containing protein n=1 Tax=Leucocoprinus leucothites TaxID=201217 RepID=A0A8H5GG24_9AGAR|nr:hypothetical protein D9756_000143 [Leucoagaricus leucothites]
MHSTRRAQSLRLKRYTSSATRALPLRRSHTQTRRASDQLFADAEREESEKASESQNAKSQNLNVLEQQHENWTGEERIQDAVLRMLIDKYKPLRGSSIVTAEERLKRTPPRVQTASVAAEDDSGFGDASTLIPTSSTSQSAYLKPRSGSWANEALLPSSPTHKPWDTTFKTPSDGAALNIKAAILPPPASSSGSVYGAPGGLGGLGHGNLDEKLVKKERKKAQQVGRLSQALESTLDYRLGIKSGQQKHLMQAGKPNPVSAKGWNSLVEERIEKARSAGVFKTVKGRGQPLMRSVDESNPFIAREEFLMNRIVQRNGAAPPWVDVQGELEIAARSFREILRQSWVRRALRILSMNNPPELLRKVTLDQIKSLRDPEWVKKEHSYHEAAVAELNSLVRKYNGLAPYAVRRPYYYSRESEIERMYETSAEDVMRELQERLRDPGLVGHLTGSASGTRGAVGSSPGTSTLADVAPMNPPTAPWRFWDLIQEWFHDKMTSRSKSKTSS